MRIDKVSLNEGSFDFKGCDCTKMLLNQDIKDEFCLGKNSTDENRPVAVLNYQAPVLSPNSYIHTRPLSKVRRALIEQFGDCNVQKPKRSFINKISKTNAPLGAKSPIVESSKVSMVSKPSKVSAFVPDFNDPQMLLDAGFTKDKDGLWYAQNRDWFPRALSEDDIVIIYSKDEQGKATDAGFCSKNEFSRIYANSKKYDKGEVDYIDAYALEPNKEIEATKCASGEVCILPAGTKLQSNEGNVTVKAGEAVIVNELENSLYTTSITDTILKKYTADPMNPASKDLFKILKEYEREQKYATDEISQRILHQKLADDFNRINRGQKLFEAVNILGVKKPKTLREEYALTAKIVKDLDEKYFSRIDVSNFENALIQAEEVLDEINSDPSLTDTQKDVATTAVMVKLLPKTNAHQHLKGSLPKEITLELARKKGYSVDEIRKIEEAYKKGENGYDNLNEFSNCYGIIGQPIKTPSDYFAAIKGIIKEAASQGQLTVEIRCAVDSLRDDNGKPISAEDGTEIIIQAIDKAKEELEAEGVDVPKTGFTFLSYRGRDWDESIDAAVIQAQEAVKAAIRYPDKKFSFDIAGPEDTGWGPKAFKEAFDIIKEYNEKVENGEIWGERIGMTIHAGETPTCDNGKPGYMSVEDAIEMGVDRIGHGVQAVSNPETLQKLVESGIAVEICGVCNIQSIPINTEGLEKHPIQEFINRDIPVILCTDNNAICGTNISKEYMQFLLTGHNSFMDWNSIKQTARDGIRHSFVSDKEQYQALETLEYRINKIQKLVEDARNKKQRK